MAANVLTADQLQRQLDQSPFNAWLGLTVLALDADEVELGLAWRAEMADHAAPHVVHGGVLGALIDVTADVTIAAKLGMSVPTIDIRIDHHRRAAPGDLRARGRLVRLGGTFAVAEARVFDAAGALIASGRGVYHTAAARA